jgi:rare lipoprotein A
MVESGPRLVQALIRPGALASWAVALALTGCATGPALVKAPPPEMPAPRPAPGPEAPRPAPKVAPRPAETTGTASWYGKAHHGQPTASGETYDMHALTAAHRSLPLGTRVLVTNVKNDRSVEVRINDRGPFVRGRILDLSYAAAQELGALTDGAFRVKLRVLEQPAGAGGASSPPPRTAAGAPSSAAGGLFTAPLPRRGGPPRPGRSTRCRRARP